MLIKSRFSGILLVLSSMTLAGSALAQGGSSAPVGQENQGDSFSSMSESKLKSDYLVCESRASRELLDMGYAMYCSKLHYELLSRVFSGENSAFSAWWQNNKIRVPETK